MAKTKPLVSLKARFPYFIAAMAVLLMLCVIWSFLDPSSTLLNSMHISMPKVCFDQDLNLRRDSPEKTFYDDPKLGYSLENTIKNWDQKRKQWLKHHPSFAAGASNRIVIVTGSQPSPCENPIGDHLLLRLFKNKVDYSRIHGYDVFYNTAFLHPKMKSVWSKIPAVRAAMVAHPEAEWIWWVDSDAVFTDMEFKLPLDKYKDYNFIVPGWPVFLYEKKSWMSLNTGVFLFRNCQWSMDFIDAWAIMGPQAHDHDKWVKLVRSVVTELEFFPGLNEQAALVYMMLVTKSKWENKVYIENEYDLSGYWLEIVKKLDNITNTYMEIERVVPPLRRRHAVAVTESYRALREPYLKDLGYGKGGSRRPFVTHFTGCQPCSGHYNPSYSTGTCWKEMARALNFADNQVLRSYGFVHPHLLESTVMSPLLFDSPA